MINAAFTFQGTELTGISAGESANPRRTVPRAIKKVLFRILIFYVLCMFFIGLLVPYNDPKLTGGSYTSNSPFIVAMNNSGTNRGGVPYFAVALTASFGALGYLAVSESGENAFTWLLNISSTAGLICWGFISASHIRFIKVLKRRGISRDSLPYKAMFMPVAAYYACFFIFLITLIQGFQAFFNGFSVTDFFTAYISVIFFVVLWIGFQIFFHGFSTSWKDYFVPLEDCDIDSGVREVDEMEWENTEPRNLWEKFWDVVA